MNLKCAVVDFDGTLFDSMGIWETLGARYLKSVGVTPAPDTADAVREMSTRQSAAYFKKTYGLAQSVDAIIRGYDTILADFYQNEVGPKPGAANFIRALKDAGARLVIATIGSKDMDEAALERCGLSDVFSAIVSAADIGAGKDDPAIYRQAAAICGADRETTLVFEDALFAARTAKADGFVTVGVYDASEPAQDALKQTCDFYMKDFRQTAEFWQWITKTPPPC